MAKIAETFGLARLLAYGTSEGVKKAWDSRGRVQQDHHTVLRNAGFTYYGRRAKGEPALHTKDVGKEHHVVLVFQDGSWRHETGTNREAGMGHRASDLKKHLRTQGLDK